MNYQHYPLRILDPEPFRHPFLIVNCFIFHSKLIISEMPIWNKESFASRIICEICRYC